MPHHTPGPDRDQVASLFIGVALVVIAVAGLALILFGAFK